MRFSVASYAFAVDRMHFIVQAIAGFGLTICMESQTSGQIVFSVQFDDPGSILSPWQTQIESHILAAGALWAAELEGTASLEVIVMPGAVPRATGRSVTSSFVESAGGFNIFEQGAGAEIRTGFDPNGSTPDIEIVLGLNYLANELWFDPDPSMRNAVVPSNRTDAMSVFLHELGHALGYNGWINGTNGSFPGNFKSTFDRWVTFDGAVFLFTGPQAIIAWGVNPDITFGNPSHWGNSVFLDAKSRPFGIHRDSLLDSPAGKSNTTPTGVGIQESGLKDPIAPQPPLPRQSPASETRTTLRHAPPSKDAFNKGGATLIDELMNGVVFFRGRRYFISELDRGTLEDVGLTLETCVADTNSDGIVNVTDLLALLAAWGPNPGHVADFNGDDIVNVTDLLALLAAWGACP